MEEGELRRKARNKERRKWLRELWVSEYPNIGRTVRAEFIIGLISYQGDGHSDEIVDELFAEQQRRSAKAPPLSTDGIRERSANSRTMARRCSQGSAH